MEDQSFLDDHDYYDDFGFDAEPDCIQRSTAWMPSFVRQYLAQGTSQQRKIKCGLVSLVGILLLVGVVVLVIGGIIVADSAFSGSASKPSGDDSDTPDTSNTKKLKIPPSFSSEIYEATSVDGVPVVDTTGFMWSDSDNRQSRIDYVQREMGSAGYQHQTTEYADNDSMQLIDNGVCRYYPGHFSDVFAWTKHAKQQGSAIVNGEEHNVWTYHTKVQNGNAYYSLVEADNTPIFLNITVISSAYDLNEQITFSNFVATEIDPTVFILPHSCRSGGERCDGKGTVRLPMIFHHDELGDSLRNQNLADSLGMGARICRQMEANGFYFSKYQIDVDSAYGPYGICFREYCNGADTVSVGRAASGKVKEMEGQCADNSDVGNWYSLTAAAACTGTESISEKSCAWRIASRTKTITRQCLESYGLEGTCEATSGLPYTQLANLIDMAFDTCPDQGDGSGAKAAAQQSSKTTTPMWHPKSVFKIRSL